MPLLGLHHLPVQSVQEGYFSYSFYNFGFEFISHIALYKTGCNAVKANISRCALIGKKIYSLQSSTFTRCIICLSILPRSPMIEAIFTTLQNVVCSLFSKFSATNKTRFQICIDYVFKIFYAHTQCKFVICNSCIIHKIG